jgi:hypothetical protein
MSEAKARISVVGLKTVLEQDVVRFIMAFTGLGVLDFIHISLS